MTQFTAADLPITADNKIYHLQVRPDQVSTNVIICGDPGRVEYFANHLLEPNFECNVFHRGLRTITGKTLNGLRVTITTSGMGTASLEIVLVELCALHSIDFQSRMRRDDPETMNIIRVGTSGALRAETKLGTAIITEFAVGLDNAGLFWEAETRSHITKLENLCKKLLLDNMNPSSRFYGKINPYAAQASKRVVKALKLAADELMPWQTGITITNSGFSAAQGRDILTVKPSIPDIDRIFGNSSDPEFLNMEMEAAFLLHLMTAAGHKAGCICPVIANRSSNTFDHNCESSILNAGKAALRVLELLNE